MTLLPASSPAPRASTSCATRVLTWQGCACAQRTCTVSPLLTSTSFHQYQHCILGLAGSDGSTVRSPLLYQGKLRISFQKMKSTLFRDHNRAGIHICEKKRITDRCCSRHPLCTASNILIRATHWCKNALCSLALHHLRRMSMCCTRRTTPCNCQGISYRK